MATARKKLTPDEQTKFGEALSQFLRKLQPPQTHQDNKKADSKKDSCSELIDEIKETLTPFTLPLTEEHKGPASPSARETFSQKSTPLTELLSGLDEPPCETPDTKESDVLDPLKSWKIFHTALLEARGIIIDKGAQQSNWRKAKLVRKLCVDFGVLLGQIGKAIHENKKTREFSPNFFEYGFSSYIKSERYTYDNNEVPTAVFRDDWLATNVQTKMQNEIDKVINTPYETQIITLFRDANIYDQLIELEKIADQENRTGALNDLLDCLDELRHIIVDKEKSENIPVETKPTKINTQLIRLNRILETINPEFSRLKTLGYMLLTSIVIATLAALVAGSSVLLWGFIAGGVIGLLADTAHNRYSSHCNAKLFSSAIKAQAAKTKEESVQPMLAKLST